MSTKSTTTADATWVLSYLDKNAKKIARAGWPGLPITQLPLATSAAIHSLVSDGTLEIVQNANGRNYLRRK